MSDKTAAYDPSFPKRPWTVCFYSFRGGVGRTTLAVNAALNLGNDETSVFALDFDLEAPGIEEFRQLAPPDTDQKGLIEFIEQYRETDQSPDLQEFIYPVGKKRQIDLTPEEDRCDPDKPSQVEDLPYYGLYVMRAGRRDRGHCRFLAQFDWDHFYRFEDGERFFENLRAGVHSEFDCSYMIVDSRTGLSENASVCTGHLADAVVLVFHPTTAHGRGLENVVRAIRDREQEQQRPIPRLYLASMMPMTYEDRVDPTVRTMVRDMIEKCEGRPVVEVGEYWFTMGGFQDYVRMDMRPPKFISMDYRTPLLHYIPRRERVRNPHLPDSYLVSPQDRFSRALDMDDFSRTLDLEEMSRLQQEYALTDWWIRRTRAQFESALDARDAVEEA